MATANLDIPIKLVYKPILVMLSYCYIFSPHHDVEIWKWTLSNIKTFVAVTTDFLAIPTNKNGLPEACLLSNLHT